MDVRSAYLQNYFDEVSSKCFYRELFPEGELQQRGVNGDGKYNAIAIELLPHGSGRNTNRYTITDDLDCIDQLLESENFVLLSPISYAGKSRESKNARFIYALAIDLDGVNSNSGIADLFHQINEVNYIPNPTYMVSSGNGLHLYYVFAEPLPCFKNITDQLSKLKHGLTQKMWNPYITELYENIQYQSIFQGFRLVGGVTKDGKHRTRAFRTGEKVTVEYLNEYVQPDNRLTRYAYKTDLTLDRAKEMYPEWYQNRIVEKKPRGTWTCNHALYEWWKGKLHTEIVSGHRYFGVMCLAIYAKKCGIDRETLEEDAFSLVKFLDSLTLDENNHFTRADVLSALEMYNDNYITFPIDSITNLTNVRIDKNKRNGRKQKEHVKLMNFIRDVLNENEDWRAGNGRKSLDGIVREWRLSHPEGSKADCIRDTGLSKPTVYKWWNA